MRRLTFAAALFLAGCATAPQPRPAPEPARPQPITPSPQIRSDVLGMTAGELIHRFGQPALQVREGDGLKLQFRGRFCVLDAYFYPPEHGGISRASHVDTRLRSGADSDQASCISSLTAP